MRRFDQRIGEIAKLSFVVSELKLRGPQADARGVRLSLHNLPMGQNNSLNSVVFSVPPIIGRNC